MQIRDEARCLLVTSHKEHLDLCDIRRVELPRSLEQGLAKKCMLKTAFAGMPEAAKTLCVLACEDTIQGSLECQHLYV